MRLIAFSDTHGRSSAVRKLFLQTVKTTELYLFAGDGRSDVESVMKDFPEAKVIFAKGNCDYGSASPEIASCDALGYKVLLTHGHLQCVGYGISELERLAYFNKASLVVYGHTHCRSCEYKNGVYYVNPGSFALPRDGMPPSYAAIDVIPAGILVTIAEL